MAFDRGLDQSRGLDRLQFQAQIGGRDAREIEKFVDEPSLRLGVALDSVKSARAAGRTRFFGTQCAGPREHGLQRGLQLVRDQGEKLGLHAIRRLRLASRSVELAGLVDHDEICPEVCTHNRELAQVPLRIYPGTAILRCAAHEEDADDLVIPDERDGEVRTPLPRARIRRAHALVDEPAMDSGERIQEL